MTARRTTIDEWMEVLARALARSTSRRSFLTRSGAFLVGAAGLPLLPINRAYGQGPSDESGLEGTAGDPTSCNYWRHCAMDGFLCSCCGGSQDSCAPGTEMSAVTWIGTCHNPVDGKDYVISYNDCCGHGPCARCLCNRNEGERPIYVAPKNNDILWCFGSKSSNYGCTVARVLGVAEELDS